MEGNVANHVGVGLLALDPAINHGVKKIKIYDEKQAAEEPRGGKSKRKYYLDAVLASITTIVEPDA